MRAHLYFFVLDHQPVLGELGQAFSERSAGFCTLLTHSISSAIPSSKLRRERPPRRSAIFVTSPKQWRISPMRYLFRMDGAMFFLSSRAKVMARAAEFFEIEQIDPFMTMAPKVRPDKIALIPRGSMSMGPHASRPWTAPQTRVSMVSSRNLTS